MSEMKFGMEATNETRSVMKTSGEMKSDIILWKSMNQRTVENFIKNEMKTMIMADSKIKSGMEVMDAMKNVMEPFFYEAGMKNLNTRWVRNQDLVCINGVVVL